MYYLALLHYTTDICDWLTLRLVVCKTRFYLFLQRGNRIKWLLVVGPGGISDEGGRQPLKSAAKRRKLELSFEASVLARIRLVRSGVTNGEGGGAVGRNSEPLASVPWLQVLTRLMRDFPSTMASTSGGGGGGPQQVSWPLLTLFFFLSPFCKKYDLSGGETNDPSSGKHSSL